MMIPWLPLEAVAGIETGGAAACPGAGSAIAGLIPPRSRYGPTQTNHSPTMTAKITEL
jgi:hypothetical protein